MSKSLISISSSLASSYRSSGPKLVTKNFKTPKIFLEKDKYKASKSDIKEALIFNKDLLIENFILPNKLRIPLSRNMLENYFR